MPVHLAASNTQQSQNIMLNYCPSYTYHLQEKQSLQRMAGTKSYPLLLEDLDQTSDLSMEN